MMTDHETIGRGRSISTLTAAVRELEIRFQGQSLPAELTAALVQSRAVSQAVASGTPVPDSDAAQALAEAVRAYRTRS